MNNIPILFYLFFHSNYVHCTSLYLDAGVGASGVCYPPFAGLTWLADL